MQHAQLKWTLPGVLQTIRNFGDFLSMGFVFLEEAGDLAKFSVVCTIKFEFYCFGLVLVDTFFSSKIVMFM